MVDTPSNSAMPRKLRASASLCWRDYEGEWKDGVRHGVGTETYRNGEGFAAGSSRHAAACVGYAGHGGLCRRLLVPFGASNAHDDTTPRNTVARQ